MTKIASFARLEDADEKLDREVRMGVRMFDRDDVELALYALEEGMTAAAAGELVGASGQTVSRWARGRVPHARAGAATMGARPRREEEPLNEGEREAYEAAMLENQLLRAVLADLKAGGWDPASISNARKAELGERLRAATGRPLREITRFLGISKSSYEYQRARLGGDRDAAIRPLVVEAFRASGGSYGYRRLHAELARRGVRVSEKRIRRVMAEEGLRARSTARAPHRYSSYRGEGGRAVAPNLLLREGTRDSHDFSAARPGERAVTDVTEFRLGRGGPKVYLSAAVDLFDGRVVAAAAGPSPSKALVQGMLEAVGAAVGPGCVLHSDRGWHYRTPDWVGACERLGIVRSMSRRGHSPDNAAAEGFFGRLKVELFRGRDWSGWTVPAFVAELGRYIGWYNEGRLKAFREGGRTVYDTIDGRRARLGLAA